MSSFSGTSDSATPTVHAGVLTDGRSPSAVSWPAIIAGAVVAAAITLILLALGAGLGFASVSPWPGVGPTAGAFTVMVGIWLIVTQWVSSGVGGYVAGRLRIRWAGLHSHEVFFRDTAHGFLTWAVATVVGVFLLTGAASKAADGAETAIAGAGHATSAYAYDVDGLFRSTHPDDGVSAVAIRAEAARILAKSATKEEPSPDDRAYLAQLVATRTGLTVADAQKRVDATIARVRHAADVARKAASALSIFTALSMFIGAFIACVAAAIGGQQRDEHA